ncbi:MAG TPA: hypothetical protein VLA75_10505, partial [Thermoanaerobaculia bacterium]|nr:hypothetical protein [Thermoanaerobaculia bacterium]
IPTLRVFASAIALALVTGTLGCARPADRKPEAATVAPTAAPAAEAASAGPQYEPAYPADVSTEGLTDKDAQQQARPHAHDGGEEHTHGEDEKEGDHGHAH